MTFEEWQVANSPLIAVAACPTSAQTRVAAAAVRHINTVTHAGTLSSVVYQNTHNKEGQLSATRASPVPTTAERMDSGEKLYQNFLSPEIEFHLFLYIWSTR